eukprot:7131864-Lingulodinium_polyedra.AAC.1
MAGIYAQSGDSAWARRHIKIQTYSNPTQNWRVADALWPRPTRNCNFRRDNKHGDSAWAWRTSTLRAAILRG